MGGAVGGAKGRFSIPAGLLERRTPGTNEEVVGPEGGFKGMTDRS